MLNFTYYNPTQIIFGKGSISKLNILIPKSKNILLTYGGGSIKRNGVYEQVLDALKEYRVTEFSGIMPNPEYDTLLNAVDVVKRENINFLLAVGGGSVLDGTKFIAAVSEYEGSDPWTDLMIKRIPLRSALPLGSVITLPATGSEMNMNAVISKVDVKQKLPIIDPQLFPVFSILDPETTFSLSDRQVANGIVDIFVHVGEQYFTYDVNTPLQDRQSEAILQTVIEEAAKVFVDKKDYEVRANLMWCATMALNNLIGCGVIQDWATHSIGHELTAEYGIDHGQSLAVVFPAMLRFKKDKKADKIIQYGERVWGIYDGTDEERTEAAVYATEEFFKSVGIGTRLKDYGITSGYEVIAERLSRRIPDLGEHRDIHKEDLMSILELCK